MTCGKGPFIGPHTEGRWDKPCPACGTDMYEGDTIVLDPDIEMWVCEECGSTFGGL